MLTGATTAGTGTTANLFGDSLYHPSYPGKSGVVGLLMDFGAAGMFICSGTLMNDRQSIVTAGHCVSDGFGTPTPLSTTVFFQPTTPLAANLNTYNPANGSIQIQVAASQYFIHPLYTGQVIDQNDIAVIRMTTLAPTWASSYGLFAGGDMTGQTFNVAGYGGTGSGALGTAGGVSGRLREGDNRYDFRMGDPLFGGAWGAILSFPALPIPAAQIAFSYLSDFDNGLAANDTACLVTQANFGGVPGNTFCNLGLGNREVGLAGGDSGGPNFIGGLLAGVNSYGMSFGAGGGDFLCTPAVPPATSPSCLNSSFGEFSGYVPINIHTAFITASLVPEPGTYAMLALGLVAVAGVARRRKA